MNIDFITKEDLKEFENKLLETILRLMQPGQVPPRKWLKSNEVRKLLKISPGTLQNLRINGKLNYTRIGNIIYYKREDIDRLLEGGLK